MAFIRCSHSSASLGRKVSFNAVIPDNVNENIPTLYLLHGLADNEDGWANLTMIELYARERGIAVIMPNASTSFYTDTKANEKYYTYISTEIVDYTRKMFRLSTGRENTFVAGNSMGGYGAVKIALSRPEIFGGAVTLSGVLDIVSVVKSADWIHEHAVRAWGEDCAETVEGSDSDLFALLDRFKNDSSLKKPRIMQICGTEDFLYGENQIFRRYMENTDFDYRYLEDKGEHSWHFWNKYIPVGMDFLLEK